MARTKISGPEAKLRQRGGAWFQNKRQSLGLTQLDVSKRLGYDYYTFVAQIESGKGKLPEEHYETVAKLFKMSPQDFAKKQLVFYFPSIFKCLYGAPTDKDLSIHS